MKQKFINYYDILGVEMTASTEQIKQAFKDKAKKYHPDKNDNSEAAHVLFLYISEAKDILTDPKKRREYDKTLKGTAAYGTGRDYSKDWDYKKYYTDRKKEPQNESELITTAAAAVSAITAMTIKGLRKLLNG